MSKKSVTVLVGIVLVCVALALTVPILYDLISGLVAGHPYSQWYWSNSEITMIALGVIALVAGMVVWISGARQLEGPEEEMMVDSNDTYDEFVPVEIRCPICNSETVVRTAQKGQNTGRQFHVCTRYPACKGKITIE